MLYQLSYASNSKGKSIIIRNQNCKGYEKFFNFRLVIQFLRVGGAGATLFGPAD